MKLENLPPEERKNMLQKLAVTLVVMLFVVALFVIGCTGCNVTRTVTTKAEYYQKGDTTVQIVTRTTESYDGSVKPEMLLKK